MLFQFFEPTLQAPWIVHTQIDGATYVLRIKYNNYGKRYYLHVYDGSGSLALCHPLISGGNAQDINIGLPFKTMIVYNSDQSVIKVGE